MKKLSVFILVVLFLCLSCSSDIESGNTELSDDNDWDKEIENGAEVVRVGSVDSYDVTKSKGNILFFSISAGDTINLKGMDTSLLSIEVKADNSGSRGVSESSQVTKIISDSNSSVYVVVPQNDGTYSLSASEIGIKGDDVIVKVRKAEKTSSTTAGVFSYQIPVKERTEEAEKGESTKKYWKFYTVDLNSEEWKDYKDSEIVLTQNSVIHSETGGGRYSDRIGIMKDGQVKYDQDYSGLISLKGLDELRIYSYLDVSFMSGDCTLNSYLMLPEKVTAGGDALQIKGFPHVFRFTGLTDSTYGYDIIISGISAESRSMAEMVASNLYAGNLRKTNGERVAEPYITGYKKEGDGYTLTLHFDEFTSGEDLLLSFPWRDTVSANENTVFGSIKLSKTATAVTKDTSQFKSGTIHLNKGESKTIYFSNLDKNYTVSVDNSEYDVVMIYMYSYGHGTFYSSRTFEKGCSGAITILSRNKECDITYTVSESDN